MSDHGAKARVLVADDEESIRFVLREAMEEDGHEVTAVADGDAAFEALASGTHFDLAFFDLRMPGQSGIELLARARDIGVDTAIVIITAQNTMENAIEAMKQGAFDYLVKPFSLAEVAALVEKALRTRALQAEVSQLRREVARSVAPGGDRLVGKSAALLEIFKTVGRVANRNVPVLITGESGTGKELVARALHSASPRAEGPFIAVNTAAIPGELLESELFGHEKGAFTGAIESRPGRFRDAAGGTLFLDEIGDMSPDLQSKLLRVLQSGEVTSVGGSKTETVDVRILAATHRDLDVELDAGRFREDLLYRLRVVPIHLPPLRARRDDIRGLAEYFVDRYAPELSEMDSQLSESAIEKLEKNSWPGNVRELENAIKRALVLSPNRVLAPDDFEFLDEGRGNRSKGRSLAELVREEARSALEDPSSEDLYRTMLERVERPLLESVLRHTEGNQIRAAAILGINRNTLRKKITELGIELQGLSRS